ncbi:ABC transporter ATP-binding protein [Apibacter muscae]|uniref:ABC transporter ATP-binding protein n=1 Tax=Apibacter muscae TaxID=2509004 RepID=A0A563DG18_9FLAO|nr:ABC transporter ATP-binding protein [Apibacter muscae]TWP24463.1 ABC transporter ATP-binding protein [Apibacter muscae]TWP28774.1 ABC transporter ATP-binding protein [Apibacter muscae]
MKSLKRILKQFASPYKKDFILGITFNILYSLFSIVSVVSIMPILDMLLGGSVKQKETLDHVKEQAENGFFSELKYQIYLFLQNNIHNMGEKKFLSILCVSVILLFFLRNVFRYLAQYFIVLLRSGVSKDLRSALYNKILTLPVSFFTEKKKGDIMVRLSNDVTEIEGNTLNAILELWRTPFSLIFTLITLLIISPSLTLIALIVLPFMAWIISSIGKSLKKDARKGLTESGNVLSIIDETLNGAKIIKIFNAEESMKNRFQKSVSNLRKLSISMMKKYELASPSSEFLGSVAMIFITWYGGVLILDGNKGLDLASFLVYIALFFQLLEPAKTLSTSISNLHKGSASTDRLVETLDTNIQIHEPENPVKLTGLKDSISFNNIFFQYQEDHPILTNVSIEIKKGKTVAIVGQSGSGKTTLVNLLARFYDVDSGSILIDGHNLKSLDLKEYRKLLGMVTQENILFNDSVINNIRLSNPNATMEEVVSAAKAANALEFIEQLPEGFETSVGEGGMKLSGGQRQRITIARAILKNPPIMILDEATASLDTKSERVVQEAFENLMSNRTSIVIAHRLSTIVKADIIIVMEHGKIMEQGTHQELLAIDGIYKKLIDMQNFS